MSFYRIFPSKDTWISNKIIDNDVSVRATGSNHGKSPTLRLFALKGEVGSGSLEVARTLIQFNLTELSGKIFDERVIPSSSVSYYLRMFNYPHSETTPSSYDINVLPVSRSWDEGNGIDDDDYRDFGFANWLSASSTVAWTTSGSDYLASGYGTASQHFDDGTEDLDVNVTEIVNNWLSSSIGVAGLPNNGLVVKLSSSQEEVNSLDYYVKVFYGKSTKFVDKIPYIEARWNDSVFDNRNNFAYNQSNALYLYNVIRGSASNLSAPVLVRIQDNLVGASASYTATVTASFVDTGIYSASFNVAKTASFSASWYDIWFSGAYAYMTGTFTPLVLTGSEADVYQEYVIDVTNLKETYSAEEQARLKVNVRKRDYKPHVVVHTASAGMNREYVDDMYFSIVNDETGEVVVPFGTGSLKYTKLSYNAEGNYFNIWMNSFVPGYLYRILFLINYNKNDKKIIDDNFLFKVV